MESGIFEASSSSAAARARARAAFSSFRSETRNGLLNSHFPDHLLRTVRRRSLTGMSGGIDALDCGRIVILRRVAPEYMRESSQPPHPVLARGLVPRVLSARRVDLPV